MGIFLLVGLLGSGKSTWARKKVQEEPNTIIINRDSLRTMFFGRYGYTPEVEGLVRTSAVAIMGAAFRFGFDVVIDETNLTRGKRAEWFRKIFETYHSEYGTGIEENVDFEVVHFLESENNLAYRAVDDLRGLTLEEWGEVLERMKGEFEYFEESEFPPGSVYRRVSIGEPQNEQVSEGVARL